VKQPAPGTMDMGDIVAGAWGMYLRAPGRWLAIAALSFAAVFVAQWALADRLDLGPEPTNEEVQAALPAAGLTFGVSAMVNLFTHAALVAGVFAVLNGQPLQVAAAYAAGARRFLPVLAGSLVVGVVAGLLAATVILLPLAVFFFVNWSMLVQVVVNEGEGPLRALSRSRQIVRGQWWRTFGIILAIALLGFLPGFLFGWVTGPIGAAWASALGAAAGSAVAAPFIALSQTLLYTDLRARKGERPLAAPLGEPR
jgi:hypothetical protein